MPAKSLKERMASKLQSGTIDKTAIETMRGELDFIRYHKREIEFLLEYESDEKTVVPIRKTIIEGLELQSIEIQMIGNANPFAFLCDSSEYDPFNYLLIASDYANYLSAVRNLYSSPEEFGGEETWLIWNHDGRAIYKFIAQGSLSALRQRFPDLVTLTIARDAGVDIRLMQNPKLIMKL